MARYTPELIAHVRHRYEDTDDTLPTIAAGCGISERAIYRMCDREGWTRRSDRPARGLPPAAQALQEATALLAARAGEDAPSAPPGVPSPRLVGEDTPEDPAAAAPAGGRRARRPHARHPHPDAACAATPALRPAAGVRIP
jgi:hypothetical protein